MAFCICLLHFLFIALAIIFSDVTPSTAENENYTACTTLYSCAKVQNAGYPFWGGKRPQFCGMSDFKLNCNPNKDPNYPTMFIFQHGNVELNVVYINNSSRIIKFSQDKLFKTCYLQDTSNITSINTLKPKKVNKYIRLSYGCNTNCSYSKFGCSNYHGLMSDAYYLGEDMMMMMSKNKPCYCKNTVTFLVDEKTVDELRNISIKNGSVLSLLTKWPLEMEYLPDFTDCLKCEKSGGRCGSSDDEASDQFVCYCPDGPRVLECRKPGQLLFFH